MKNIGLLWALTIINSLILLSIVSFIIWYYNSPQSRVTYWTDPVIEAVNKDNANTKAYVDDQMQRLRNYVYQEVHK